MKKKIGLLAFLFLSAFEIMYAYDFAVNSIYYTKLSGTEVEVTYGTSTTGSYSGSITIPKTVYYGGVTYKVVSIGTDAFSTCKSLTSVTIGANVTSVGKRAFDACSALTKVYFESPKMTLEKNAFRNCSSISELHYANIDNIVNYSFVENQSSPLNCSHGSIYNGSSLVEYYQTPSNATAIPAYAFYGCSSIKSISFDSNSKIDVGTYAFYNCASLTYMNVNSSIETGEYAFQYTNLQTVSFGKNVDVCFAYNALPYQPKITRVNFSDLQSMCSLSYLFKPNTSLSSNYLYYNNPDVYLSGSKITRVSIPSNVEKIGDGAFYGLKSLTSVDFSNSVKEIGSYAFYECTSLSGITLKNGLETINRSAFNGCSGISSVDLPSSLQYIGSYAFRNTGISSFFVPNSVQTLEKYALTNGILTSVVLEDGEAPIQWLDATTDEASFEQTQLTDFYVGRPLNYTFYNSYNLFGLHSGNITHYLKNITFGEYVKEIPKNFFMGISNYNLAEIKVKSIEPPTLSSEINLSSYTASTCVLKVPEGSKELYAAHPYWGKLNIEGFYDPSFYVKIMDSLDSFVRDKDKMYSSIIYTRAFTNTTWNALYVPFAMSYDDWSDDFEIARLNDVHQFDDDEDGAVDRTVLEVIKLMAGSTTEPNTPYMIKAKEVGEKSITLTNATLYATEESSFDVTSWFATFTFTGTYSTITDMATKGHYAMANGGLMQASSDAATLGAFRWYLDITDRNGNPAPLKANSVFLSFDDGETAEIKIVEANTYSNDNAIYTISGTNVGNDKAALPKGLYINNGKKIIIK